MGSQRRPLGRSYSGNGRYSLCSPRSADGPDPPHDEDEGPAWVPRPDSRSYLLSIRPENRSTFCAIISQLTEETQPLFETTIKSRSVSENADAKFTCIVTGFPQPEVTWYKDDEEMDRYCGLPKYEILHHGNRHTLQLYKCREEDAAIYQASARNNKGIVSCSGVLEVGTMTEFKIHQKWFAKLKRKAEAKLREIEQGKKRGKENMEVERLNRVSPERFPRKRRLTGDMNPRSGALLWEKDDMAKVHVVDPKSRLHEETTELKEPSLNAVAGFSNNMITKPLKAEVTTNGDSSLESAEENGNGFLTYIYETVEEMTAKPIAKESSAKKKKKENEPPSLLPSKQEASRREEGVRGRGKPSQNPRFAPFTTSPRRPQAVTASDLRVEDVPKTKESGKPVSQEAKSGKHQPCPPPPQGEVYFSLKEMFLESRVKPIMEEGEPGASEVESEADLQPPAMDSQRKTSSPATKELSARPAPTKEQNSQPAEQKSEEKEAMDTEVATMHNKPSRYPTGKISEPPSWTMEPAGENIQATDLLDSVQPSAEQPLQPVTLCVNQMAPGLNLPLCGQETRGSLHQISLEEQLVPGVPAEAPEMAEPVLSPASNYLKHPSSEPAEDTNQQESCLKEVTGMDTEQPEEQEGPRPYLQEPGMLTLSQEGIQQAPEDSQKAPADSPGLPQPVWEEHLPWKEEEMGPPLIFTGKETQQRPFPSCEIKDMGSVKPPLKEARPPMPEDKIILEQHVHETEVEGGRIDQPLPAEAETPGDWLGDSILRAETEGRQEEPSSHETDQKAPTVAEEISLETEVAAPVFPQVCEEEQLPASPAEISVPEEAPGLAFPSPVKELPSNGTPSVVHLLRDMKKELENKKTDESALHLAAIPQQESFPTSAAEEGKDKPVSVLVVPQQHEAGEQRAVTPSKKQAVVDVRGEISSSDIGVEVHPVLRKPLAPQAVPGLEGNREEISMEQKVQHKNLVSSLKNYLLLLLKMSDKGKDSAKAGAEPEESEAGEVPPAIEKEALPEVGIAGLSPRTSKKIFEKVQTNQLFQTAESLPLTPRTSRKITGMINQELITSQETLVVKPVAPLRRRGQVASESEGLSLLTVPSIVVGSMPAESAGQTENEPSTLNLESSGRENPTDPVTVLPCATPEELASGARRKIYLSKAKQAEEAEVAAPEGPVYLKRESPTVSPRQSRKNTALLQAPVPTPSPPVERRSPTLTRKMATLEVPKLYEEHVERNDNHEPPGDSKPEVQAEETRKTNDPFKAPQVIRKIRPEQFSDASGNLKLWCQFFNILSESKLMWYKDEVPIAEARRSTGDEGQVALAIVQASRKDCGVYQCVIQNEYGTDSTDFLLSAEVLSGLISREEIEVGEEIEMTPMVFAKGLAESGYWGDKFFGRIMCEDMEVGDGFQRKACRVRAIYGLEPIFESGRTCLIKVHNLIIFGTKNENTLIEKNYDITIQECKIQNSSREYCKIFAAEARAILDFGAVPEIIPLYLIYRPANNIPYATMEEDLEGPFERYCVRERDGSLAMRSTSEISQKCCSFQHWLYQWTNGNILVTDMEGVGWKITNVRIATKLKGYQGLKESCFPTLLEQFAATHQCNHYCEILGLKTLEAVQQPVKSKGSKSPSMGRKASSTQSSPQLQKKGLASPQGTRKGTVSPKSSRKSTESGEAQLAVKSRTGESSRSSRLQ
ncbi:alpha-protein kinase 3 isoform X1 [Alligator mississippiensis]|uniref:alpha-protein kinase 3 isoform X1 n=2 Tax=Alligator mississippiensis TaxID=8496 RepID=UPI002877C9DD|nr:alpha-protein kinase 3 isoform X1 [Alligator mississippiensis]